jgi:hypothetical protein
MVVSDNPDAGPVGDPPHMTCPQISSLSISPERVDLNIAANLAITTTGPKPLFVDWTAEPSGTFSDPHALSTRFLCAAPGETVVRVSVDAELGCAAGLSGTVTCLPSGSK